MTRVSPAAHLAVYVAVMTAMIGALVYGRAQILDRYAGDAGASWERWKADTQSPRSTSTVARRPVTAPEPPMLVLARDHFAAALTTCLAIGTFLFAFMVMTLRGALRSGPPSGRRALDDRAPTLDRTRGADR